MAFCKGCKFLESESRYRETIYKCHHPENLQGELYPRNQIGKRYLNKSARPSIRDINHHGECGKWKAGLLAMFGFISKEEPNE